MSSARGRLWRTYLGYGVLALLFPIAVIAQYRDAKERIERFYDVRHPRFPIDGGVAGNRIDGVEPEAAAAGVKIGDYLVSVNGRPFRGTSDFMVPLRMATAGDVMTLGTRSTPFGAVEREAGVTLAPVTTEVPSASDWALALASFVGVPVACMLLGFFVAAVRVRDPQAWMLLVLLLGFSRLVGGTSTAFWGYDDVFQPAGIIYMTTAEFAWPIGMTLFGIYFGGRLPLDRRFPWAKWILLAPLIFFDLTYATVISLTAHDWAAAGVVASLGLPIRVAFMFLIVGVAVFFAGTGYKAFRVQDPDARRRLKLLHAGASVSLTPLFIVVIRSLLTGNDGLDAIPAWLGAVIFALLFLFPVTLAYVIVVQKAMDLRVVIRQGVQYLLASGSVRALQVVLSVGLILAAALLATEEVNRPQRIAMIAIGLAGVAVIQGGATRLRGWVDRRFFREAYNAEQILSDLADKVRTFVETGPLLETVARRISESLHVPRVAVLLHAGHGFQPAYSLGYSEPPRMQIPEESATAAYLRREGHARVYPEDESSWIYGPQIAEEERAAFRGLESQLLFPLTLNQKLLGILSLGPKQSEEPFSKGDLRLLGSVVMQTGLALENSRLAASVASEVAQRERMNREIEIAREVQERMFPQECPPIEGLDYWGACRPARGVGGDYYDFIPISATEVGLAIGDVSGKGIPAALLMASLRASLRGQTIRREDNLGQLMATVNQLVYESSSANRYATFFYVSTTRRAAGSRTSTPDTTRR